MQLDIASKNYDPTKRVRSHIEDRAQKFGKYVHDLKSARFTLIGESKDLNCEIHLHAWGKEFHAKASADDMLASVDKACSNMEKQLRRYKTKRTDHKARFEKPGLTSAAALEATLESGQDGNEEEEQAALEDDEGR